jgi:catechol 2,3-dioxygenase-like lactoylglutathione lyase family enzyme
MSPFESTRDIIIRTEAFAEATEFYRSVLGFQASSQSADLVGFETGAIRLYVERGRNHGPVFELLVPDVEAAKARLLAAGCVVIEEDRGVPRCYLRDPYGFTFNIGKASDP